MSPAQEEQEPGTRVSYQCDRSPARPACQMGAGSPPPHDIEHAAKRIGIDFGINAKTSSVTKIDLDYPCPLGLLRRTRQLFRWHVLHGGSYRRCDDMDFDQTRSHVAMFLCSRFSAPRKIRPAAIPCLRPRRPSRQPPTSRQRSLLFLPQTSGTAACHCSKSQPASASDLTSRIKVTCFANLADQTRRSSPNAHPVQ